MSDILLPVKLRPRLRHGPEWTEEVDMAAESLEPITGHFFSSLGRQTCTPAGRC